MSPIPWAGTGLSQMSSSHELCRLPHECRVRYLLREQFPSLPRLLPLVCRIGVSHDWRHLCAQPTCHCRVERHAGLLLASCSPRRMFEYGREEYGLSPFLSIAHPVASANNPSNCGDEESIRSGRCPYSRLVLPRGGSRSWDTGSLPSASRRSTMRIDGNRCIFFQDPM